jgi:hypothetical protein
MTIPTVSPFDSWCDGKVISIIEQEDVLDTVRKPICATHHECDVQWQAADI